MVHLKPRLETKMEMFYLTHSNQNSSIDLPIVLDWGLPFGQQNTPVFEIKDLDNSEVYSESSFRQSWRYSDDIQLDIRGDLVNDLMISPIFYDLDAPYSKILGKAQFILEIV